MSELTRVARTLGQPLLDELEAIYIDVHRHPELSMQELRTAKIAADNVQALGYEVTRGYFTLWGAEECKYPLHTVGFCYGNNPTAPDHETVATAVFSQPEIGTVGLSEDEAAKRFSELEIYRAHFRPMRHTLSGRDEKMLMKLVVDGATRKVLGAHILGPDAGEMAQLLGIPIKAGLSKDDFDRTMAVHPTAAEELVTMYRPTYRVKDGERVG